MSKLDDLNLKNWQLEMILRCIDADFNLDVDRLTTIVLHLGLDHEALGEALPDIYRIARQRRQQQTEHAA